MLQTHIWQCIGVQQRHALKITVSLLADAAILTHEEGEEVTSTFGSIIVALYTRFAQSMAHWRNVICLSRIGGLNGPILQSLLHRVHGEQHKHTHSSVCVRGCGPRRNLICDLMIAVGRFFIGRNSWKWTDNILDWAICACSAVLMRRFTRGVIVKNCM